MPTNAKFPNTIVVSNLVDLLDDNNGFWQHMLHMLHIILL